MTIKSYCHESLLQLWMDLNAGYFGGLLPPIDIAWSRRLTSSAGLFVSLIGPRSAEKAEAGRGSSRRHIKLSLPLLDARAHASDIEVRRTLAHEMIHQWQYDILKRRPNHGADFRRMMSRMNQDGLRITIYHSMYQEVDALARYVWRCRQCGYLYRRHRRTIQPRRHQCGACRGPLQEVRLPAFEPHPTSLKTARAYTQLTLDFST